MVARRVVPILLIAGAVMMITRHHHVLTGERREGERSRPIDSHGEWGKRVPPLFEIWHKRAHEQEQAAQQPAAI